MAKKSSSKSQKKVADPSETSGAGPALPVVKHFRLSEADAETWDAKVNRSGKTASEFFRAAVIENKTIISGMKTVTKESPVTLEYLRLLARQGNNINQIAKALNEARAAGEISAADCLIALRELQEINNQSKALLEGDKQ